MKEFIQDNYTEMTDREMARYLEVTEDKVKSVRREAGCRRLVEDENSSLTDVEVEYELSDRDKRQLQGFVGEMLSKFASGDIIDKLRAGTGDGWKIVDKASLVPVKGVGSARLGDTFGANKLEIKPGKIVHSAQTVEEASELVEQRVFAAESNLINKIKKSEFPSIDRRFFGIKASGSEIRKKFDVVSRSSSSLDAGEKKEYSIPVIEDAKVFHVEIKTSPDSSPEQMFSKVQRKARNKSSESPFSEFYSFHIDLDIAELEIPSDFTASMKRHDIER